MLKRDRSFRIVNLQAERFPTVHMKRLCSQGLEVFYLERKCRDMFCCCMVLGMTEIA